ncbi:hypothetical protein G6P99_47145 [Bradyrhizobium sp. 6(2017)]|nr:MULTISPECIES: hypothetical protein [unclassified Bradyrhizobium]
MGDVEQRRGADLVMLQDRPAQDAMPLQPLQPEQFCLRILRDQDLLGAGHRREPRHQRRRIGIAAAAPEQRRLQRRVALDVPEVGALAAKQQHMVAVEELQLGDFCRELEIGADPMARPLPHRRVLRDLASAAVEERPDLLAADGFHG